MGGDRTDAGTGRPPFGSSFDPACFCATGMIPLVGTHGDIERLNGFFPTDKQRYDHVEINHHVPQGQLRHVFDAAWSV